MMAASPGRAVRNMTAVTPLPGAGGPAADQKSWSKETSPVTPTW